MKKKIKKFRDDEIHHKNIAYDNGASKEGLYSIFNKIIKTGSKIAINISSKGWKNLYELEPPDQPITIFSFSLFKIAGLSQFGVNRLVSTTVGTMCIDLLYFDR